jgi:hypothetical protein
LAMVSRDLSIAQSLGRTGDQHSLRNWVRVTMCELIEEQFQFPVLMAFTSDVQLIPRETVKKTTTEAANRFYNWAKSIHTTSR